MKPIKVEVTSKHANEGIPAQSDSCALALALKDGWFKEDNIHVEVSSEGTVEILMDGEYEEDTGITPRKRLYTLYPDSKQEGEICEFIEDYDGSCGVDDYDKVDYMNFPYNFTFFRTADA